jgi:heat shock protein HtpX
MYEQIAANKRGSVLVIASFVALLALIAYVFWKTTYWGPIAVPVAIVMATVGSFGSYYYSDRIILGMSGAKPVTQEEYPYLYNVVEGLAIAAGVPMPKPYVIADPAPNAFATGRDPEHAAIAVTQGLLDKMNRAELEGVIGHEMSHIKDYDIRLAGLIVVMVGIVALLSDWLLRSYFWGGRRREGGGDGEVGIILMAIGLVLALLAPLAAQLMRLAISRQREYLADASGAMLTRYPEGLASALRKLEADTEVLRTANKATANLYIVNPLHGRAGRFDSMFDTHPPLEDRIARLEKLYVPGAAEGGAAEGGATQGGATA